MFDLDSLENDYNEQFLDDFGSDPLRGGRYYVYAVYVNSYLKYIGMGQGNRYKHAISGTSHVKMLNKCFYSGKQIVVRIVEDNLFKEVAAQLESDYINYYLDNGAELYNKRNPNLDQIYEEGLPLGVCRSYSSIPDQAKLNIKIDTTGMKKSDWSSELFGYLHLKEITLQET